jgi:hypothetical protein
MREILSEQKQNIESWKNCYQQKKEISLKISSLTHQRF